MTEQDTPRAPRAFDADDPAIVGPGPEPAEDGPPSEEALAPTVARRRGGAGWGSLLISAMAALTALAASVAYARFVSQALERDDWVGWTAAGLLSLAALAALVLILREIVGLFRLARLGRLKREIEASIDAKDVEAERRAVKALRHHFAKRHDVAWGLAKLAEHERDVRDPGELLRLADRELLAPLDGTARRMILASARRVSIVTAMSPMMWAAVLFVLVENLRLLRGLAGLYGGRPGFAGSLRLAKLVAGHIIATGGVAMTDDLLGQFLGQDLLRRLSRRLGEGAFNGALTARVGTAAIDAIRPMRFLEATPVRARDIIPELMRRSGPSPRAPQSGRKGS